MNRIILAMCFALGFSVGGSSLDSAKEDWRTQGIDAYKRVDKELNRVYKKVFEQIAKSGHSPEVKKAWVEQQKKAQRIWVRFRDADAKVVEYDWIGGSGMGLAKIGWKQGLTQKRIEDLKSRYSIK